jgi:hypothetical protein
MLGPPIPTRALPGPTHTGSGTQLPIPSNYNRYRPPPPHTSLTRRSHLTYPACGLSSTQGALRAPRPAAHLTYPAARLLPKVPCARSAAHLTYPAARLAIHGAHRPHVSLTRRPCTHHSSSVSTLRVTIASWCRIPYHISFTLSAPAP